MFQGLKDGLSIIKMTNKVLFKYPKLLLPLIIAWIIQVPVILYFTFWINDSNILLDSYFFTSFVGVLVLSINMSFSAMTLLKMLEQIEINNEISLFKAMWHTYDISMLRAFPIILIWAILWFIVIIIQALTSDKKNKRKKNMEMNTKNVAKALSGFQKFSLSRALFEAVKTGLRMAVFLIFPAIVWEEDNWSTSIKKGLGVLRFHYKQFAAGFVLTQASAALVFLPAAIFFYIDGKESIGEFPDFVWHIVIVYTSFAWSYSIYIEQMFVADLYLWHKIWQRECDVAESNGEPLPELSDVSSPSFLDGVDELSFLKKK
jgi:hypothetical protein